MPKLLSLAILVVLALCAITLAEDAVDTDIVPPVAILTIKKKCHRKANATAVSQEEEETEPVLTTAEIEEQCNRTTEYKTYMECLQHYETLKSRTKRNALINADDCDNDECDDEYEDCGSCTNTCRSCNSRSSCNGCSSCSRCTSRPCCARQCNQKCGSSSCRVNCKRDCYDRVNENINKGGNDQIKGDTSNALGGSATANATNLIDQAINITTVIKFNNLINTSNIVDIPITVNNTNINNITLTQTEVQRQALPPIDTDVPTNTTTPGPCCHIIYPRECHTTTEFPFKRCFHRRRRFCGPECIPFQNGNLTFPLPPQPIQPNQPIQPPAPVQPIQPSCPYQHLMPQPMYQPMQYFQPQFIPQFQPQFIQPQFIQQQPPQMIQQPLPQVISQPQQPQIILDSQLTQQFQSPCQQRQGGCGMIPPMQYIPAPIPPVQYIPAPVPPMQYNPSPCPQGCAPQGSYSYPSYDYYLAQGAAQNQAQNNPQGTAQGTPQVPAS